MANNGVDAWSFSRYNLYQQCPYKYYLVNIKKMKEPAGKALARGRAIHDAAAKFLTDPKASEVPEEMKTRSDLLTALKGFNGIYVEQKWAFTHAWRPTTYFAKNVWLRNSLDVGVDYGDKSFEAIDWKTGRMYGDNEEQMDLFATTVFARFPSVEYVMTRLSYVDLEPGPESEKYETYDRASYDKMRADWERKVEPMFNDTTFAPRQNDKCHMCHFNASNGGPCRYG